METWRDGVSDAALEVMSSRGHYWEVRLFAQVLVDEAARIGIKKNPVVVSAATTRMPVEKFLDWYQEQINSLNAILEKAVCVANGNHDAAFGVGDERGDPEKIIEYARAFMSSYEAVVLWLHGVRALNVDPICRGVLQELSHLPDLIMAAFDGYGKNVMRQVDELGAPGSSDDKPTINAHLSLRVSNEDKLSAAVKVLKLEMHKNKISASKKIRQQESSSRAGYVYVLINPRMPNLCKVGKTIKKPTERSKEVSSATGVPQPFIVAFFEAVKDCDAAERACHAALELKGLRLSQSREFFEADLSMVIRAIVPVLKGFSIEHLGDKADASGEAETAGDEDMEEHDVDDEINYLCQEADEYFDGSEDCLINYKKALTLYEQAAALGSGYALLKMGLIFEDGGYGVRKNAGKAMELLNRAAALGATAAYVPMARIFSENFQYSGATKCYANGIKESSKRHRSGFIIAYMKYIFRFPSAPPFVDSGFIDELMRDCKEAVLSEVSERRSRALEADDKYTASNLNALYQGVAIWYDLLAQGVEPKSRQERAYQVYSGVC